MDPITPFLRWYFIRAPHAQLYFINNALSYIEDKIGVQTNVRFFFAPIFGDRTWTGRILSIIFRLSIVVAGTIVIVFLALVLFCIPIVWYATLVLWVKYPIVLVLPACSLLYYLINASDLPEELEQYKTNESDIQPGCDAETKKLLSLYNSAAFYRKIAASQSILNFCQRTLIPLPEILSALQNANQPQQNMITNEINKLSQICQARYIRPTYLFVALINVFEHETTLLLKKSRLDNALVNKYLQWDEYEYTFHHHPHMWDSDYKFFTGGGTNRTWQGTITPTLNQYSYDLTSATLYAKDKIVRRDLIDEIEQALQKNTSPNVMLVGEIGVGKETVVRGIALAINKGTTKGPLWSKRIVELDVGRLFAGTTERGSFENRIESILDEIERSGNIVLYLNEFNTALETTNDQGISLFTLLQKPASTGKLHVIGSITPKEYKTLENSNPTFLEEFTVIHVPETDAEQTSHILHSASLALEQQYNLFFPYPMIDLIFKYAVEYQHEGFLPQKALALLDEIAVTVGGATHIPIWHTKYGAKIPVLEPIIDKIVTAKSNIPVGDVEKNEAQTLLHLEEQFQQYIVDQTEAVHAVAEVLRRNRSGLRDESKPIGSFLFVGPTGVGKTEMAKTLAKLYFGNEDRMVRLDMSEYQGPESIDRLLGEEGQNSSIMTLTERIRRQPFSLILLDELEKAHPKILDLFLQVLDDARLTDANGTTVNFEETIIIATSNAGTLEITKQFHDITASNQYELIHKDIYHILTNYFRIEFLNRFDQIILFKPLTPKSITKIVMIQLEAIAKQLYQNKKITITFSQATIDDLVKTGYNSELGARPLKREIQDKIESQLARQLLEGKVSEGETIEI